MVIARKAMKPARNVVDSEEAGAETPICCSFAAALPVVSSASALGELDGYDCLGDVSVAASLSICSFSFGSFDGPSGAIPEPGRHR